MKEILQNAIVQMVRIGNKVNWNAPIDQDYVNALNGLRELLEATQQNAHQTGGGLCAECGSPAWTHSVRDHAFVETHHPQVA